MAVRKLKRLVREALASDDWRQGFAKLAGGEGRPGQGIITALLAALSSDQALVRWRAVFFLGRTVAEIARDDPEAGREVMRRLVWGLNEESGAVAWGAPEAMGEIMALSALLADEFASLLISYVSRCGMALDFAPLRAGAVWGLGRLCQARPGLMRARCAEEPLMGLSREDDPQVRGLAAWALGWLGGGAAALRLGELRNDEAEVELFEGEVLRKLSIGQIAGQGLQRIAANGSPLV